MTTVETEALWAAFGAVCIVGYYAWPEPFDPAIGKPHPWAKDIKNTPSQPELPAPHKWSWVAPAAVALQLCTWGWLVVAGLMWRELWPTGWTAGAVWLLSWVCPLLLFHRLTRFYAYAEGAEIGMKLGTEKGRRLAIEEALATGAIDDRVPEEE